MQIELIKEGVLNDDILKIADEGKVFKGNYEAILEYYTFANSQGNHKNIRRFRSIENAIKFIKKNY